ncbi:MAG: transposase [Candidatus Lokiarchaeota archaeon]|nr:transposase [Candidatus Lokiarchaeota archaeon]
MTLVKPNDRVFKCKECGYKQDRDVVVSINILKKYLNNYRGHSHLNAEQEVENYPILSNVCIMH